MLLESKGIFFLVWEILVFCWLVDVFFGCRDNHVFYAYLEPLLGFREERVFGEKQSFTKVQYFTGFPLLIPLGDSIFFLVAELWTKVDKNHIPEWASE